MGSGGLGDGLPARPPGARKIGRLRRPVRGAPGGSAAWMLRQAHLAGPAWNIAIHAGLEALFPVAFHGIGVMATMGR